MTGGRQLVGQSPQVQPTSTRSPVGVEPDQILVLKKSSVFAPVTNPEFTAKFCQVWKLALLPKLGLEIPVKTPLRRIWPPLSSAQRPVRTQERLVVRLNDCR